MSSIHIYIYIYIPTLPFLAANKFYIIHVFYSHTTETENFNSTHLSFVLKKTSYKFEAMEGRTLMAVIDYNHDVTRPYLTDAQDQPLLKRRTQKKSGKFVVGAVKQPKTYR